MIFWTIFWKKKNHPVGKKYHTCTRQRRIFKLCSKQTAKTLQRGQRFFLKPIDSKNPSKKRKVEPRPDLSSDCDNCENLIHDASKLKVHKITFHTKTASRRKKTKKIEVQINIQEKCSSKPDSKTGKNEAQDISRQIIEERLDLLGGEEVEEEHDDVVLSELVLLENPNNSTTSPKKPQIVDHRHQASIKCDECDYTTNTRTDMIVHLDEKHKEVGKNIELKNCGFKTYIVEDMNIHNGICTVQCDECQVICCNKNELIEHKLKEHKMK